LDQRASRDQMNEEQQNQPHGVIIHRSIDYSMRDTSLQGDRSHIVGLILQSSPGILNVATLKSYQSMRSSSILMNVSCDILSSLMNSYKYC